MKKGLTTHVLDVTRGKPAEGIKVELWKMVTQSKIYLASGFTNEDGRLETPLLETVEAGEYELLFHVEEYVNKVNTTNSFFTIIPIRFRMEETEDHYHIPLLLSGFGFQTYRGS